MSYTANPSNINLISSLIKQYNSETQKELIMATRCFVIDTCSFEFYKKENRRDAFAQYIKVSDACIIVFRTILMELAGDNGVLQQDHIDFFEHLFNAGVSVYVLYEEDIFDLLQIYTDNKSINRFLKHAVLCIKQPTGIVNNLLEKEASLKNKIIQVDNTSDITLYDSFFQSLRAEKRHEDNLGEIACLICIHILANMEEINAYKYVFLTEDRDAVILTKKVIHNSRRHRSGDTEMIGTLRFPSVIEKMYKTKILNKDKDVEDYMHGYNGNIKMLIKTEYVPEVSDVSLSFEDFVKFICHGEGQIIM